MTNRVLYVIPDAELGDEICDLIEEKWTEVLPGQEEPLFDAVSTDEEARKHLAKTPEEYRLLVTSLDIPADRKSPRNPGERGGLSLIEHCRTQYCRAQHGRGLPSIVLADVIDSRLNAEVARFPDCELVGTDWDWQSCLRNTLTQLLVRLTENDSAPTGQPDRPHLTVDITLGKAQGYRIHANRVHEGGLHVDRDRLRRLVRDTRDIGDPRCEDWKIRLRELGEDVYQLLRSNLEFTEDFRESLGSVGSEIERTRFRFIVGEETYPIALEAIVPPTKSKRGAERFWMLQAPVSRSLAGYKPWTTDPLFARQRSPSEPVNCLILEAEVHGRVNGGLDLGKLDNVGYECAWLESFLEDLKGRRSGPKIGEIKRITQADLQGGTYLDEVREVLKSETFWHLVHYAGHSSYDPDFVHPETGKKGRGYFYFPAGAGKRCERVKAEDFARWIRGKSLLLYLSSCHSSEDDIVYELAENLIPAIVGFRWDIEDERAKEHTQVLYTNLLTEKMSIEKAFLETRRTMYDDHKQEEKDKSWASPMLVLQVAD